MADYSTAGLQLQVQINANYTLIPNIDSVTFSGGDKRTIETTAISDTAPKQIGGLKNTITVSAPLASWDPTNSVHQYLMGRYNTANTTDNWKIILPIAAANNTLSFSGEVLNFLPTFERDSALGNTLTVGLSGSITQS